MSKAIAKDIPKAQSKNAALILKTEFDEKEFFFLNDGFSYKVGNHINAVPSSIIAVVAIIAVDVNRCFGLIERSFSLNHIKRKPRGIAPIKEQIRRILFANII